MQLKNFLSVIILVLFASFILVDSRKGKSKKNKKNKGLRKQENETVSNSTNLNETALPESVPVETLTNSTANETGVVVNAPSQSSPSNSTNTTQATPKIDVPSNSTNSTSTHKKKKKNKNKKGASNIYSHIILSRLYAFETKMYPLLMHLDLLPQSNDTEAIGNADIMIELQRVIGVEIDKPTAKKMLESFDKSLSTFFTELTNYGNYAITDGKFTFTRIASAAVEDPASDEKLSEEISVNTTVVTNSTITSTTTSTEVSISVPESQPADTGSNNLNLTPPSDNNKNVIQNKSVPNTPETPMNLPAPSGNKPQSQTLANSQPVASGKIPNPSGSQPIVSGQGPSVVKPQTQSGQLTQPGQAPSVVKQQTQSGQPPQSAQQGQKVITPNIPNTSSAPSSVNPNASANQPVPNSNIFSPPVTVPAMPSQANPAPVQQGPASSESAPQGDGLWGKIKTAAETLLGFK
jgi:hypothetical protein